MHLPSLEQMILYIPAIVIGLTFHEFAHGWVAYRLGDPTAKNQGRLTFNPVPHLDPIGLIMLFLAGLGWAKPVPVNPFHFRGDRARGMLLVSLAGPGANIVVAFVAAFLLHFGLYSINPYLQDLVFYVLFINVGLAIFNLIPVPPLDGSKILAGLMPKQAGFIYNMEAYGMIILLLLVFTGLLGKIILPLRQAVMTVLITIAGIPF